jgi:hypothetical protein
VLRLLLLARPLLSGEPRCPHRLLLLLLLLLLLE